MGIFKGLLGRDDDQGSSAPAPKLGPGYQRLHGWIESRIGRVDPADPNLKTKLDGLLDRERSRYPSPRGRLTFTRSGNDTIVSGDTRAFKGSLRGAGLEYDRRARRWIARNKVVTESDIDVPSQLQGLKRYIEANPYRNKF
ncbi:MAG: hypothetical protein SA339_04125 [Methanomassiliicoccus sp.]|nr:hypothetical protein [Methanomassiliicoccus sp.]